MTTLPSDGTFAVEYGDLSRGTFPTSPDLNIIKNLFQFSCLFSFKLKYDFEICRIGGVSRITNLSIEVRRIEMVE
jgi:hypothetical protein